MPDDPIIGWKSYQFLFGASEALVEESEAIEIARVKSRMQAGRLRLWLLRRNV